MAIYNHLLLVDLPIKNRDFSVRYVQLPEFFFALQFTPQNRFLPDLPGLMFSQECLSLYTAPREAWV